MQSRREEPEEKLYNTSSNETDVEPHPSYLPRFIGIVTDRQKPRPTRTNVPVYQWNLATIDVEL